MLEDMYTRTRLLIGDDKLNKIKNSHIWLFGAGGVGGFVAEALIRAGVGKLTVVDGDTVNVTNLNRQVLATHDTIGKPKVSVLKERALSINPDIDYCGIDKFYTLENADEFDFSGADYVIDAIDMVSAKIDIIVRAKAMNLNVISSMGTGNKTDNTKFEITDIYKTHSDPLARVIRRELKARGVKSLNVVYSPAEAIKINSTNEGERPPVASISFVPATASFLIAGKVINDILDS